MNWMMMGKIIKMVTMMSTLSSPQASSPTGSCDSQREEKNLASLRNKLTAAETKVGHRHHHPHPICLWQHATRSGGFIRTEKIGQYYFGERWKGLLMGQSIPTHCGGWRFQVPTGKG